MNRLMEEAAKERIEQLHREAARHRLARQAARRRLRRVSASTAAAPKDPEPHPRGDQPCLEC
jgi:hypothetical protein